MHDVQEWMGIMKKKKTKKNKPKKNMHDLKKKQLRTLKTIWENVRMQVW